MAFKRIFLIVLDSFGIGCMPDAADYGDAGADTLRSIAKDPAFCADTMGSLGLFDIPGAEHAGTRGALRGVYGKMTEASHGKDTIIGHWEMCGVVSDHDMPTYPDGFPQEVLVPFSEQTGRGVLCNRPYSGTAVIADYGEEHMKTGKLIVYTSADSVFQIAAHEDIVPVEELYRYCEIARKILVGKHGVGRVIARPFVGVPGSFSRTTRRHDYALTPPHATVLDLLSGAGLDVIAVGKINDIFASQGPTYAVRTQGNADGMKKTDEIAATDFHGFCFVNLVDFDMLYGHRNDVGGYARATAEFDAWLSGFLGRMREDDLLLITGDHGCDPGYPTTDHTREYTPLLAYAKGIVPGSIGIRRSFADIGKTVTENFGVGSDLPGDGFLSALGKK